MSNEMAAWDDSDQADGKRSPDALRRIVRYQRWLIAVVLAQLALWGGYIVLGSFHSGEFAAATSLPMALTFILGGVGGVFVFLLAWEIRGAFAAILFGFATVIPCMGLLILTL